MPAPKKTAEYLALQELEPRNPRTNLGKHSPDFLAKKGEMDNVEEVHHASRCPLSKKELEFPCDNPISTCPIRLASHTL